MYFSDLKRKLSSIFGRKTASLPHYVRDYRRHVKSLLATKGESSAMELAVGGEFHSFGIALKDFVVQCGLKDSMTLIDVGCGSGRMAYALRRMNINYAGFDVVPELIDYAEKICERPDWKFRIVKDLKIPLDDASTDMVVFVSVFTHLRHEETYIYLAEAKRILKPNGTIVFTFLDFSQPHHWIIFQSYVDAVQSGHIPMPVDQFIDESTIATWAEHLELEVVKIFDGSQRYIRLSEEITLDNGSKFSGDFGIGQSACLLRKPSA